MPMFFKIVAMTTTALILRFAYLGTVPVSLSHDEVDMVIQAHSLRLTGSDLSGSWDPWSLLPNDAVMAELAPLVNAPMLSIFPNSLFVQHATTALLGSIYPALIVILLLQWGWGSRISWLSGILLATSPWHILFSRTNLEQPVSLFFYTLSWIFLSRLFKKNTLFQFVLSTFIFVLTYSLGFYTYHGFKFVLPALTIVIAIYLSIRTRLLLPLLLISVIIGSLYVRLYVNLDYYSSRGSEIIFLDPNYFAQEVNADRQLSLLPDRITNLMSNKVTSMASLVIDKYLYALSPTLILATGEPNGVFGTGRTGYIYLVLAPFLLFGLVDLMQASRPRKLLLLLLLILSPLATVVHVNNAIAFRSAIYFVLLTTTAAIGIVRVQRLLPNIRIIPTSLILVALSLAHFSYVYLAYYPVESAKAYFFADHTLATYLSHRDDQKILVIDPQPRYIMSYLALTNREITVDTIQPLLGNYSIDEENNQYQIGNLTIRRDCQIDGDKTYDTFIVDATLIDGLGECSALSTLPVGTAVTQIVDPLDNGRKKVIYNDRICNSHPKPRYIALNNLSQLNLAKLTKVDFCTQWLVQN